MPEVIARGYSNFESTSSCSNSSAANVCKRGDSDGGDGMTVSIGAQGNEKDDGRRVGAGDGVTDGRLTSCPPANKRQKTN